MAGSKRSTWIGGTVVVALVLGAAAWFLAISPTLASAQETRTQASETRDANELLEQSVALLKAQSAKLPEYKKELAALQVQIPTTAKLSAYLRQIDTIAESHGVVVTSLSPSPAVPFTVPVAAAPAPAPAAEGEQTTDPNATPTPAPVVDSGVPAGMVAIPVSVTVVGTFENAQAFLKDMQSGEQRILLIGTMMLTSQKEAGATGGRPATKEGDAELVITGFIYALPAGPVVAADPGAKPAPLPGTHDDKNPLDPIKGH
ncbi:hypothetical protein [Cellulomonas edaphi]|uniref:Pilus assembly protein PilO n=1 Tax=Cellulomonas edaphi TaxID=3053468 RepID=A0ABT7S6I4_9CELL|nr:hypothetical protein [Cellulomons edaphi]MDM7831221.1 hypothetical protein [Cellulomons edaphi]